MLAARASWTSSGELLQGRLPPSQSLGLTHAGGRQGDSHHHDRHLGNHRLVISHTVMQVLDHSLARMGMQLSRQTSVSCHQICLQESSHQLAAVGMLLNQTLAVKAERTSQSSSNRLFKGLTRHGNNLLLQGSSLLVKGSSLVEKGRSATLKAMSGVIKA